MHRHPRLGRLLRVKGHRRRRHPGLAQALDGSPPINVLKRHPRAANAAANRLGLLLPSFQRSLQHRLLLLLRGPRIRQ